MGILHRVAELEEHQFGGMLVRLLPSQGGRERGETWVWNERTTDSGQEDRQQWDAQSPFPTHSWAQGCPLLPRWRPRLQCHYAPHEPRPSEERLVSSLDIDRRHARSTLTNGRRTTIDRRYQTPFETIPTLTISAPCLLRYAMQCNAVLCRPAPTHVTVSKKGPWECTRAHIQSRICSLSHAIVFRLPHQRYLVRSGCAPNPSTETPAPGNPTTPSLALHHQDPTPSHPAHRINRPFLAKNGLGISSLSGSHIATSPSGL